MSDKKKYSAPRWHDNPLGKASVVKKADVPLTQEELEKRHKEFKKFLVSINAIKQDETNN